MEVSDIIDKVDMVEYIGRYTDLEKKNGEFWGLSPFTQERTPSFSVDPEKGFWYDFSTSEGKRGGNILDFIMKHDKVSLKRAVDILKEYAHIVETEDGELGTRLSATSVAKRYRVREARRNECTAKFLPDDYMKRFRFDLLKLSIWEEEDIPMDIMRDWDIRYDDLDNRIVYPVRDFDGHIFCVSGRTLDPDYKEHGVRKYTYTSSIGALPAIYGLYENRETIIANKEIILVEGCKSVLKLAGWGIRTGAALLTSHLSQPQFDYLVRLASFNGVRVVFALDSDVNIEKDERIRRLQSYASVSWVKNRDNILQEKEAPVDRGKEAFLSLYERREILS